MILSKRSRATVPDPCFPQPGAASVSAGQPEPGWLLEVTVRMLHLSVTARMPRWPACLIPVFRDKCENSEGGGGGLCPSHPPSESQDLSRCRHNLCVK